MYFKFHFVIAKEKGKKIEFKSKGEISSFNKFEFFGVIFNVVFCIVEFLKEL